jgi:hypothetical protein
MLSPPFQPIRDPFAVPVTPQPTSPITPQHGQHHLRHHSEAASVPPSPYAGLSEKQVKRLEKEFKKTDTKIEFARALLGMTGADLSKEEVIKLVAEWTGQTPEARPHSVLTAQDFGKLCPYIKNIICINDEQLIQSIPYEMIPTAFLSMLQISRHVSSRRNELGTRNIINIYLDVAVYIARQVFHEDRLVVHQEYDTAPTEIPEIGMVSGPLDYVTSRAAGNGNMGKLYAW